MENTAQIHKLPKDGDNKPQDGEAAAKKPEPAPAKGKRGKLFAILGLVVLVGAASYGIYYALIGSKYVSTDNAYVAAEVAVVTPSVGGTVKDVRVVDTQAVKKGDVLVVIDDIDAKLALEQAEADLGRAERRVQGYFANNTGLAAAVDAAKAEEARAAAAVTTAQANLEKAKVDLDRREALAKSGSVSGEELTSAQNAYATAKAALDSAIAAANQSQAQQQTAIGNLTAGQVLTANADVENNPEVQLAKAKRDQAKVDLDRTIIRSPVDGVVAKRSVQIGQRLQAGTTLMSIVPLNQVHVDANFKEVQLRKVRIGQPVELTADIYGGSVKYHGRVAGFSGGTGAAFAIIPAQNATGNWIKVVQRLPVRVTLDEKELQEHPLQVGLSMEAEIDISGDGTGTPLLSDPAGQLPGNDNGPAADSGAATPKESQP